MKKILFLLFLLPLFSIAQKPLEKFGYNSLFKLEVRDSSKFKGPVHITTTAGTSVDSIVILENGVLKTIAIPVLAANTYTATKTDVTNIASSTFQSAKYQRIGNIVNVSGTITVTPTASGACEIGFSLPVASAFSAATDAEGSGYGGTGTIVSVTADATNDRLKLTWSAPNTNSIQLTFTAQYTIL